MPAGEEDRQKNLFQTADTLPAEQRLKTRSRPRPFVGNRIISPRELFPWSSGFPRCPHTGARFPKGPGPQPCASDFGGRAGRPLPGSCPPPPPNHPAARAAAATRAWLAAARPLPGFPRWRCGVRAQRRSSLKGPRRRSPARRGPRGGAGRADPESPWSSRGERRFVSGNVRSRPARSK